MLNHIWLALILISVGIGAWNGHLPEVTTGALNGAKSAVVDVILPLVGTLAVWMGVMRLAERSGLVEVLARALRPMLRFLFPEVPPEHPAMGSMVMNIAANMLGLGNAATPMGLKAMSHLEKLNPQPGTATNAMCTFLAINTSSVQLIPATVVALLAAKGAKEPTAIVGTALVATSCACAVGVTAAKFLQKLPIFTASPVHPSTRQSQEAKPENKTPEEMFVVPPMVRGGPGILWLFGTLTLVVFVHEAFFRLHPEDVAGTGRPFLRLVSTVSLLAIPFMLAFFPLYAALRGLKVYAEFVEGAKEGVQVALKIVPFLVSMLMAIGMFRGSDGLRMLTDGLRPVLSRIGFPADLLPLVLMRPLSGGGTQGIFVDLLNHFSPDSLIVRTAGTIFGSTETTFYVLAVYFGSVAVRRTRHAVAAGLIADATGVIVSIIICRLMFGPR